MDVSRASEQFVRELTRYQNSIYIYVVSMLHDPEVSRDVLQNVNVVLWQKADRFTEGTSFLAWAKEIARYEVLAYRRDRARDRHLFDDEVLRLLADHQEPDLERADERASVFEDCLQRLTERQRKLLEARYASVAEADANFVWADFSDHTGTVYVRSEVTAAMIRDGLSNTYMIGEKYLNPLNYETGLDLGDNHTLSHGHNNDTVRWTTYDPDYPENNLPPMQDRIGLADPLRFGGPHAGGCNFVMCDGSVQTISYSIDPRTHGNLGNRRSGQVVSDWRP